MAESREWTAEIRSDGFALYAWMAFNPEWRSSSVKVASTPFSIAWKPIGCCRPDVRQWLAAAASCIR